MDEDPADGFDIEENYYAFLNVPKTVSFCLLPPREWKYRISFGEERHTSIEHNSQLVHFSLWLR